jgi:hypothetical protein
MAETVSPGVIGSILSLPASSQIGLNRLKSGDLPDLPIAAKS